MQRRNRSVGRRRLCVEVLEDRRLLAVAAFAELSASLGLGGLQGGSGEFHAGGLTFTDLNNDGFADLYLIGPSSHGNRLYVNVDDGNGGREFDRVVNDGGASYAVGNSTGSVAADYDNDGDLDIYLTNYNADNGKFISEDPIGFAGGDSNLYRYAGNDPVNFRDPSGLTQAKC